ncbi:hypothetical protein [Radicibacter daui]|uniref:hypothetical protein n=1 Tax=Radicibacter daui TaxID=3064829 RepID=UPI004046C24F
MKSSIALMVVGFLVTTAGVAYADDAPSGHYVFAEGDSTAALKAAGRSAERIQAILGKQRGYSIDFDEDTTEFRPASGTPAVTCSWDVDDKDEIVFSGCVDDAGEEAEKGKPAHVDWMDDDSLEVYEPDGSKLVYRKQP